jgi:hypothetical protein
MAKLESRRRSDRPARSRLGGVILILLFVAATIALLVLLAGQR